MQWLICGPEQNAYFSHDHGHYFPGGPAWTVDSLRRVADSPRPLPFPTVGLDAEEATRISERILAVTECDLLDVVGLIPRCWPVSDVELEAVVDYLVGRRAGTAARLRAMIA